MRLSFTILACTAGRGLRGIGVSATLEQARMLGGSSSINEIYDAHEHPLGGAKDSPNEPADEAWQRKDAGNDDARENANAQWRIRPYENQSYYRINRHGRSIIWSYDNWPQKLSAVTTDHLNRRSGHLVRL